MRYVIDNVGNLHCLQIFFGCFINPRVHLGADNLNSTHLGSHLTGADLLDVRWWIE